MQNYNLILDTDSYKASHINLYPKGTTKIFDYIESRGGLYPSTIFAGMQYYIRGYLNRPITIENIQEASEFFLTHGEPFNIEPWTKIITKYDGYLPLKIRAIPEGTLVPVKNALVTVESVDPELFWIASWIETSLLRTIWSMSNVATISFNIKRVIYESLVKTSDDPKSEIDFKLHDFGSRGVSSQESALMGGMAHLFNFKGSDTVVAAFGAKKFYDEKMAAFSIPATEHSTITSWGKENEAVAYENVLNQFGKPGAIFACVSDSYNLWNAVENIWGGSLKQKVIDSGATLVVRPDSGTPWKIVPEVLQRLESKFGSTTNSKGYKVLNHVRVIQGDGVEQESIEKILKATEALGYSTTNLAFGMGGALLQKHNRDTNQYAMKCSSVTINGKEVDVFKDPVTDHGKKSKSGRLDLIPVVGWNDKYVNKFETIKLKEGEREKINSCLQTVYRHDMVEHTVLSTDLQQIRNLINKQLGI